VTQLFVTVSAGLGLILSMAVHPAHASEVAITGARLVTVSGATIENGTIVISDGKIRLSEPTSRRRTMPRSSTGRARRCTRA